MLNTFLNSVKQHSRYWLLLIFAIVLEPIAYLSKWYMKMSSIPRRRRHQREGKAEPWTDLAHDSRSPVVLVLQYYSLLAAGRAPRLRLLMGRKYKPFAEWAQGDLALTAALRNGIHVAASWVAERLYRKMMRPPWLWATIVDPRSSPSDVESDVGNLARCLMR